MEEPHDKLIDCQIKGPNCYDTKKKPIQFFCRSILIDTFNIKPIKENSLHHTGSSPCLATLQRNGWPLQYTLSQLAHTQA